NPENGWIQNCNSTPYTSALEFSPKKEDYPYYMSRDQENFRGVHAIELLKDRSGYTLDSLIQLAHDPYLPAFEVLVGGLIDSYYEMNASNFGGALKTLENWDYTTSKESIAMTLAHYYGMEVLGTSNRYPDKNFMELINYWGKEAPGKDKQRLLTKATLKLMQDFGTWQMPWGEVNRYQRLNGDIRQAFDDAKPSIPIGYASGTWGALAAYGARYTNNTKKLYGTRGNSFVAVVEFGEKVKAKSILAGGQSGDPASPHFDDQIDRYANAQFKEVAYYKEDVLKRARKTYKPGE
ncbi:MAG: penicillin acylase family protein, partial [Croceitalea sp.]|nr:penicillin acylase family protein [Croceitalea sp.]NNC33883.1 acylase [Croceitalea sp.]